ncbi:hypothetical protein GCM10023322_79190 [Rugosimonospora acidiphila]|uniref:Uncharacterized protein n=1 Tax=Rugosimonospora acidiphila TaxID=556531 RepID=A0ABP9SR60_9ACTN
MTLTAQVTPHSFRVSLPCNTHRDCQTTRPAVSGESRCPHAHNLPLTGPRIPLTTQVTGTITAHHEASGADSGRGYRLRQHLSSYIAPPGSVPPLGTHRRTHRCPSLTRP